MNAVIIRLDNPWHSIAVGLSLQRIAGKEIGTRAPSFTASQQHFRSLTIGFYYSWVFGCLDFWDLEERAWEHSAILEFCIAQFELAFSEVGIRCTAHIGLGTQHPSSQQQQHHNDFGVWHLETFVLLERGTNRREKAWECDTDLHCILGVGNLNLRSDAQDA